MMIYRMRFLAAASVVAVSVHAQAGAQGSASDAIVVTATRDPAPLMQLPYSVTPLDGDALAAGSSLADALARLPDGYVQMSGGRSGFAALFLRGADPNFTTVMLEGVPLDSPTNSRGGAVNLAAVPQSAIARAELVAGPVSTLYGSGPLAGTLNLLLARPTEQHRLTASATLGTEGDHSLTGLWQGPLTSALGGSLTAVWDDAGTGEALSGFRARSVDLRVGRRDGGRGSLLLHLADTRAHGFPDSSGGHAFATIRDVERRTSDELIIAADHVITLAGGVSLGLAGAFSSRGDQIVTPGVAPSLYSQSGVPAGEDDIRYRRGILRPDLRFDLGGWHATLGAQAQWEAARSNGYLDFGFPVPSHYDQRRETYSGFAELGGTVGPVELNGGLRIDDIEGIGAHWSARAGVRYAIDPQFSIRAAGGTAFKAPSFYALANPFIGNPDLKPESAASAELGLDWHRGPVDRLSVTVFGARYRDLIDFVPSDPPRLENRAHVTTRGISVSATQQLGQGLVATLGAQHVLARDGDDAAGLLNRPRWRASGELRWATSDAVMLSARYAYTDARDDYAIATGVRTLEATHRVSASVAWTVSPRFRLRVDGENLLQDRGADAIGFAPLPRRLRITLIGNSG